MFQKATKLQARGRVALDGPSGSGKTFTMLRVGSRMAERRGGKFAVIDTERGSASKYADMFDFDVVELDEFSPQTYIKIIEEAGKQGYAVLGIDSLSHAWMGKGGALEQVDRAAKRSGSGNSFTAWREVTPVHNQLVDAILNSTCDIIVTMRTKTEWVLEEDSKGKKVPRRVGMAPIQRDGMEYEFDVVGDMNHDNELIISKSRCPVMSGEVYKKPGEDVADIYYQWLTDGASAPDIDGELEAKWATLNGRAEAALQMLVRRGSIKHGQTPRDMTAKDKKKLLDNWAAFEERLGKEAETNGNDEHTADRAAALGID